MLCVGGNAGLYADTHRDSDLRVIRAGTEMYSYWEPREYPPRRECTEVMVHEEEAEASDG